jgi:hypothetical protein
MSKTPFPVELLFKIFPDLSPHDLCSVSRLNRTFYAIAAPFHYRHIVFRRAAISLLASQISCLKVLCKTNPLAALVQTVMDLDWSNTCRWATRNPCRLLNQTLRHLSSLSILTQPCRPVWPDHDLSWLYNGCQFSLSRFATDEEPSPSLCRFLESQLGITDLELRSSDSFNLDASALPRLTNLKV